MTRSEEIDLEIRNLIARLRPRTAADFEIPALVYTQILKDNDLRKRPYRVSYERIQKTMHQIATA